MMRSESMDITESLVLGLGRTNPVAFRYTALNMIYIYTVPWNTFLLIYLYLSRPSES